MRRVWIKFLHANQREWDRENQAAGQVSPQQDKEYGSNHSGLSVFSTIGCARAGVRACFSDSNSALSEKLMMVRISTIAPRTIKSWTLGFISVSMKRIIL